MEQTKPRLSHSLCFMFSGKAGTGKTYSAAVVKSICASAGLSVKLVSFATGVKSIATSMGWNGKKDARGRKLLQSVGYIGRAYDPTIWVRTAFGFVEEDDYYPFDVVIVDDWRFVNEINYVDKYELLYKTIPIRLHAPDREILLATPEYNDASETELDSYQFPSSNIVNNSVGSTTHYDALVSIVMKSIEQYTIAPSKIGAMGV